MLPAAPALGPAEPVSRHSICSDYFVIDGHRGIAQSLSQILVFQEGLLTKQRAIRISRKQLERRRTVMRIPLMQGWPQHLPASTVMRSSSENMRTSLLYKSSANRRYRAEWPKSESRLALS